MSGELPTPIGVIHKGYYVPVGPMSSPDLDSSVAEIESVFLDELGRKDSESMSLPTADLSTSRGKPVVLQGSSETTEPREQGQIVDGCFIPASRSYLIGILPPSDIIGIEF